MRVSRFIGLVTVLACMGAQASYAVTVELTRPAKSKPAPAPAAAKPQAATPAEGTAEAPAETQQAQPAAKPSKPLLVIRFNQKRVYFDRALRQAITGAERAKPGVAYAVTSYAPSGERSAQSERFAAEASEHLRDVVTAMKGLGVEPGRIQSSVEAAQDADSVEVHIYVE